MKTHKCLDCTASVYKLGQRCRTCYNLHKTKQTKHASFKSPVPYVGFDVYGPRVENTGRLSVSLRDAITKKQFTMTVARYLFSVGLGKVIDRKYHVDHLDADAKNNDPSNLQLLTRSQNISKGSRSDGSHVQKIITFTCAVCRDRVLRRHRKPLQCEPQVFLCSRKCAATFQSVSLCGRDLNVVRKARRINRIVRGFTVAAGQVPPGIRLPRISKRLLRVIELLEL